jgi:transcription initiation factor TFIID subunit TAF12
LPIDVIAELVEQLLMNMIVQTKQKQQSKQSKLLNQKRGLRLEEADISGQNVGPHKMQQIEEARQGEHFLGIVNGKLGSARQDFERSMRF